VVFDASDILTPSQTYVICHSSADDSLLAKCNMTVGSMSNGDDVFCITSFCSGEVIDCVGTAGADPGSGWNVAGVFLFIILLHAVYLTKFVSRCGRGNKRSHISS